jgi:hypothetical protein
LRLEGLGYRIVAVKAEDPGTGFEDLARKVET